MQEGRSPGTTGLHHDWNTVCSSHSWFKLWMYHISTADHYNCSDSCTHPLALGTHCVANDVGTIGGSHGRQQRRFPVNLQNPWSLSNLDVHLVGWQRRACGGTDNAILLDHCSLKESVFLVHSTAHLKGAVDLYGVQYCTSDLQFSGWGKSS